MLTIETGGAELFAELLPLWEALFDHHASVGAGGLATIPRAESWPLRRAHYERIFEAQPWARVWLVRDGAEEGGRAIGYALAFGTEFDGRCFDVPVAAARPAFVLETLSLLPAARGAGVGGELMRRAAETGAAHGAELGIIDVMGGNTRARQLYLRSGYLPYSESWMRARPPEPGNAAAEPPARRSDEALTAIAARLGFELEFLPGPDDSWVSSDRLAALTPKDPEREWARTELERLFAALEGSEMWMILVEIPVATNARPRRARGLRERLREAGFSLGMERVVRELRG